MPHIIRIMLVEDNSEYREIISLAIEDEPNLALASQYGTSEIALRDLRNTSQRPTPDLILLDLRLPGMDGLESLPLFRSLLPDVKIIILTQSDNETDVLRAISQGANGYLLKTATVTQITEGIRTVMAGGATLDAGVARFIMNTLKARLPKDQVEHVLTKRELEILTHLGEGLLKKEIAKELHVSAATVATHVAHI
ncbi:MAG: response regulator transcription factor, partial [Phycisphaeraceae bacterium]|nr:response regulator transcription factor [Phycisphaeraceae bacterium]